MPFNMILGGIWMLKLVHLENKLFLDRIRYVL